MVFLMFTFGNMGCILLYHHWISSEQTADSTDQTFAPQTTTSPTHTMNDARHARRPAVSSTILVKHLVANPTPNPSKMEYEETKPAAEEKSASSMQTEALAKDLKSVKIMPSAKESAASTAFTKSQQSGSGFAALGKKYEDEQSCWSKTARKNRDKGRKTWPTSNILQPPEFEGLNTEPLDVLPQVHDYLNSLCYQANISNYIRDHPFRIDPNYRLTPPLDFIR